MVLKSLQDDHHEDDENSNQKHFYRKFETLSSYVIVREESDEELLDGELWWIDRWRLLFSLGADEVIRIAVVPVISVDVLESNLHFTFIQLCILFIEVRPLFSLLLDVGNHRFDAFWESSPAYQHHGFNDWRLLIFHSCWSHSLEVFPTSILFEMSWSRWVMRKSEMSIG